MYPIPISSKLKSTEVVLLLRATSSIGSWLVGLRAGAEFDATTTRPHY
jgi:hypothetical protein